MANLFDKTYIKLLNLKEDLNSTAEIEDFFDNFLVKLQKQLLKALPNTQWQVLEVSHSALTINDPTNKVVSAKATLLGATTDFDLQADFDFNNPIHHKGWDEYQYKKGAAPTTINLIDYIVDPEKHGIYLGKFDDRFSKVEIKIDNLDFTKIPYAYKYLSGANTQLRVSKFAQELEIKLDLAFTYSEDAVEANDVTAIINEFFTKIYDEKKAGNIDSNKRTPTQLKLIEFLDGLTWEAVLGPYDIEIKGTGYSFELDKVIERLNKELITVSKFIITGGDF